MSCLVAILMIFSGCNKVSTPESKIKTPAEEKTVNLVTIEPTKSLPYSKEILESSRGNKVVFIYFYDADNQRCQKMDKKLKEFANLIPDGGVFLTADYKTDPALAQQYNVTEACQWAMIGKDGAPRGVDEGKDFLILLGNYSKVLEIYGLLGES